MKITSKLIFFLCFAAAANAQTIFKSADIYQNELHDAYYVLLPVSEDIVLQELENYLEIKGKVSKETEQVFSIDRFYDQFISRELSRVVAIMDSQKEYSKVTLILLDETSRDLRESAVNRKEVDDFLHDFYANILDAEEERMIKEEYKQAEDNYLAAEKEFSRAEKAVQGNLKDQEKLGKKLEASPEKLTEIIKEKDQIYQEQLQKENEGLSEEAQKDYNKKLTAKEREIVKSQQLKEKNASKLEKKEAELVELTSKLIAAKKKFQIMKDIYELKKKLF